MAYACDLSPGHSIYFDNHGSQTIITIATHSSGQQQQASSSFQTGSWTAPPQVFETAAGTVLKIATAQGESFIQIQAGSVSVLNQAPFLSGSQQLQVQPVSSSPTSPMQPMQPMQPMKPMNLGGMQMNPMEMRMGNMQMRMGPPAASESPAAATAPAASSRRFCSQCGTAVASGDRFCSNCGHQL